MTSICVYANRSQTFLSRGVERGVLFAVDAAEALEALEAMMASILSCISSIGLSTGSRQFVGMAAADGGQICCECSGLEAEVSCCVRRRIIASGARNRVIGFGVISGQSPPDGKIEDDDGRRSIGSSSLKQSPVECAVPICCIPAVCARVMVRGTP